ncbi:hypothetical protein Scep_011733 [Stephania cephalantha]|uniref:Uncharacterized protein n=1 Tax=Stephania cephalantha TaxID=152367 RepID=A0AAP0P8P5_9MAGN
MDLHRSRVYTIEWEPTTHRNMNRAITCRLLSLSRKELSGLALNFGKNRQKRPHKMSRIRGHHRKTSDLVEDSRGDRVPIEESTERRRSSKRKERGESEDRSDHKTDKRVRVSSSEKRRLEDKTLDDDDEDEEEDSSVSNGALDENGGSRKEGKRERRRFGDKAEENVDFNSSTNSIANFLAERQGLSGFSGSCCSFRLSRAAAEPLLGTSSSMPEITPAKSHPPLPSTDVAVTSTGAKTGNLSLAAIAKAKEALQRKKELSEKLKMQSVVLKEGSKVQSASTNSQQGSIQSTTGSVASSTHASSSTPAMPSPGGIAGLGVPATAANYEAVKRAQELAASMGFRHDPEFAPLINMFPGHPPSESIAQQKPAKAPVLRLDALGREIDEHGNVINMSKPTNLSTLKVNINKQKKEAFQILKPELDVDPELNPHFDASMGIDKKKLLRPKRMGFQFVKEGEWSKEADRLKNKNAYQSEAQAELKVKQAQLAKAKAEPYINPNLIEVSERVITKEKPKDPIPDIEWCIDYLTYNTECNRDAPLVAADNYDEIMEETIEGKLKKDKITIYVEHPLPIEPPAEPAPPPPQPLKLTKKEQKKLRTQRRLAKEKDRQEMIRQGLLEPPKPKVKMSNLMKVLGSEATQDPTRLEMEIRTAAAEREQAHVDRNIARKLTPAERRCAVITDEMGVVVVEGGRKSMKRFSKLMLKRINWAAAVANEDEEEDDKRPINKCMQVWEGSVAKSSFKRFSVHQCMTEAAARKVFSDAGVSHYWDLAVNFVDDDA